MNEQVALNVTNTVAFFAKHDIVPLQADNTHGPDHVKDLLNRLGGSALPVYAIFPAGAADKPIVFDGPQTSGSIIAKLEQALNLSTAQRSSDVSVNR